MNRPLRRAILGGSPILAGLALMALSMAWSIVQANRPVLAVEGLACSLGTTPPGGYHRHSWTIRNRSAIPLKLRTKFTSGHCGFSLWLGEDWIVAAGSSRVVSLTCPIPMSPGTPYFAQAEVSTDDPERPRVRFRVVGITEVAVSPQRLPPE